jgi:N-acetylglucosaminyl-diphospho-decaprenol L-rhamnosyltransferase
MKVCNMPASPSQKQPLDALTVIVVTYNSAHCIAGLAPALRGLTHLILVDNASTDDTVGKIVEFLPNARLLLNEKNEGFGAANNRALQQTSTPFALLLNPDTLPDPDFFEKIIEAGEQFPEAAMIAPQLVRRNDSNEINYRWPSSRWKSKGPGADGPCCVGFLCGAAIFIHIKNMEKIGFFDENFFLYYEDEDLSQRAFLNFSPMIVVPQIRLKHLSRGSVKGQTPLRSEFLRGYHHAQSKLLFEEKYNNGAKWLQLKTLALAMLLLPLRLLLPQPKYIARLIGRTAGLISWKSTDYHKKK